jgi:hypothetical protein
MAARGEKWKLRDHGARDCRGWEGLRMMAECSIGGQRRRTKLSVELEVGLKIMLGAGVGKGQCIITTTACLLMNKSTEE